MKKRFLSCLLLVCMLVTMMPITTIQASADSISGPITVTFHPEIVSPTGAKVKVGDMLRCGYQSHEVIEVGSFHSPYDIKIQLSAGFNGNLVLPDGDDLWEGVPEVAYILGNGADSRHPGDSMPIPAQSNFRIPYYFKTEPPPIEIEKVLEGRDWMSGDSFTFHVEPADAKTTSAVNSGKITLNDVTITKNTPDHKVQIGITCKAVGQYLFNVREVLPSGVDASNPTKDGITYDTSVKKLAVQYTALGGLQIISWQSDDLVFTNKFEEAKLELTDITKELVTGPSAVSGVTWPSDVVWPDADGKVQVPDNGSVKLAYTIKVTGDAGAAFRVTDTGATLVGSNCGATTQSNGVFTGTVPASGTALLYVTKVFYSGDVVGGVLKNTASMSPGDDNTEGDGEDTEETLVKDDEEKNIDGLEKTLIDSADKLPEGMDFPALDYPNSETGKVEIPEGGSVTLAYDIKVTGDEGAAFRVTDTGATLVGSNCKAVTESAGVFTGTIPAGGVAHLYVTKTFTADDLDENGNLVNQAAASPNDPSTGGGGEDEEKTPGEDCQGGCGGGDECKQIGGLEKTLIDSADKLPEDVVIPPDTTITYPNESGKVEIPEGGSVTLAYDIKVTGDEGAEFRVTDTGATLIGSNCNAVTAAPGVFTGTIPAGGVAHLYVIKTFTQDDLDENGNLANEAKVEPNDPGTEGGGSDKEETPGEEKPETPDKELTSISKTALSNADKLPEGIELPGSMFFPDDKGHIDLPKDYTGNVSLLYEIKVTGDVGAEFHVTDQRAELVHSNCNAVTTAPGKFSGVIPAGGEALLYVVRSFTVQEIKDGNLTNIVGLEPGDGSQVTGDDSDDASTNVGFSDNSAALTDSIVDLVLQGHDIPEDVPVGSHPEILYPYKNGRVWSVNVPAGSDVTLLFHMQLSGDPHANFTLTATGGRLALLYTEDEVVESGGGITGHLSDDGKADVWFTKTFTQDEVSGGNLNFSALVSGSNNFENRHIYAVTPVIVAGVSYNAPASSGTVGAVVEDGTTYSWTDTDTAAESVNPSLLFSGLNTEEQAHTQSIQQKTDAALGGSPANRQYDIRYIDLIDEGSGKSLQASGGVDIYWPYPAGTDRNTAFSVLHFEGVKRGEDGSISGVEGITPTVLGKEDGLTLTDTHIRFHTDSFSPFVLVWEKTENNPGGGGGNGGNSGGGGGSGSTSSTRYTLTYDSNGGTVYPAEKYPNRTTVKLDKVPMRDGWVFDGWYLDKELTEHVEEVTMRRNITVYAKWVRAEVETDVPAQLNGEDHIAYLTGYEDGTIRPTASITRAETAAIFYRVLKDEVRTAHHATDGRFSDVPAGSWYGDAANTLANMGIVNGKTDSLFDPEASITRAEFAAIAARFAEGQTAGGTVFTDTVGHWAEREIAQAASSGWINGVGGGLFNPDAPITRGEAAAIINRMLCRTPKSVDALGSNMITFPDNMDTGAWYYLDIQEAANTHEYEMTESGEHWL